MVACGVCIGGFSLCVFLDVVTRTIGHPWLWLQQATTAFFAWGAFVGMAAATRRNDHIYLSEITKRMRGRKRTAIETLQEMVAQNPNRLPPEDPEEHGLVIQQRYFMKLHRRG